MLNFHTVLLGALSTTAPFQLEITTTTPTQSITIPHLSGYSYDYTIDYGDGTGLKKVTSYNDVDCTHIYATPSGYTVTILGSCPTFYVNNAGTARLAITKILAWGNSRLTRVSFNGCSNLTQIATDVDKGLALVSDFTNTFSKCTSLTDITPTLFDYATGALSFNGTFSGCTALTGITAGLFNLTTYANNFNNTFYGCTGITNIPAGLFSTTAVSTFNNTFTNLVLLTGVTAGLFQNLATATSFSGTFSGCTQLVTSGITGDMFSGCSSVTNFSNTFNSCNKITTIPSGIFDYSGEVTSFDGTFSGLTAVTTIPTGLFNNNTKVTSFANTFSSCSGITSIPSGLFNYATGVTSFVRTFLNCTSLTGAAPELWNRSTVGLVGTQCFTNDTLLNNRDVIPVDWGGLYDPSLFKLEIQTTTPSQSVQIPMINGYVYNYTVDWGDGTAVVTVTGDTDSRAIHTYTNVSGYTMAISGRCETFFVNNAGSMKPVLTKIKQWGSTTLKRVNFYGCTNLISVVSDTGYNKSLSGVTDFNNMFDGCTSLSSIPVGLFDYAINVSVFNNTFSRCFSLTSAGIPIDIFRYNTKVTDFTDVFYNCLLLSGITADLFKYNVNVTTFNRAFQFCTALSGITTDLFRYNTGVTDFRYAFYGCSSLVASGITSDIFRYNTKVTTFYNTFYGCSSLSAITTGLFDYNVNATTFTNTFNSCSSLLTIPSGLFDHNTGVTDFSYTFGSCGSLTSIPNNLFDYNTKVNNFSNVFTQCTKLQSIPTDLFKYNTNVNGFDGTFYSCPTLTTIPIGLLDSMTGITSMYQTFAHSTGITSISNDLLQYNTKVTNFQETFHFCQKLTSIPIGLFRNCPNVTNFTDTFSFDVSLKQFPNYSDWFLPSKDEMYAMYTNLQLYGFGNFSVGWYWSSSEVNSTEAWIHHGTVGSQITNIKSDPYLIRACRSFTGGTYNLRDIGPSGGWIFITGATYYEATTVNSNSAYWSSVSDVSNATGVTIGTGQNNTNTIVNVGYATSAAKLADTYSVGLFDACTGVTSFINTFNGCTGFVGYAPELWFRTPEPTGTTCFTSCTGLTNYNSIPSSWGGGMDDTLQVEVTVSTSQSLTIPMTAGYTYNYTVDWGDGSAITPVTGITDTRATHIYTVTGGFNNWFMPSINELNEMYTQLYLYNVGGYTGTMYWSSTEANSTSASIMNFFSGGVGSLNKANTGILTIGCRTFTGGTYSLRDKGPAGGWIFITGATYYETTPTTLSGPQWSNMTTTLANASGITIGTGQNNTNTIIAQVGHTNSVAKFCDDYAIGNCTIKISGTCETFYVNNAGNARLAIKRVLQWGKVGLKLLNLNGCSNMTSIVTDNAYYKGLSTVTTFIGGFYGCSSLISIPSGLFDYATNVTSFVQTFLGCSSLTSIPSNLFKYNTKVTTFQETFNSCSGITTIPSGLFDTNVNNSSFNQVFANCTNLLSIPTDLFKFNTGVTTFQYAFINDTYLPSTGIPTDLFRYNTVVDSFNYTFGYCKTMKYIPTGLFDYNTKVTNMSYVFAGATGLSGITLGLFRNNVNVTNFSAAFYGCTGITELSKTDWFLPSINELNTIYSNLYLSGITGFQTGNYYWSSTESNPSAANAQRFDTGVQGSTNKAVSFVSRAVRKFTTGTTYNLRDIGPAGGWIFYKTGNTYYECAPYDTTSSVWSNIVGTGTSATDISIGAGSGNTLLIINQSGHTISAAKLCHDYTGRMFDTCTGVTDFSYVFYGLPITLIPADLFKYNSMVTTFSSTFQNCKVLEATGITSDIFRYNPNVTSFDSTFYSCSKLTGITTGIFNYNTGTTVFQTTFYSCSGLTSIPSNLFNNNTRVTNFLQTFWGCSGIQLIPTDMFKYNVNVTNFGGTFYGCTALTSTGITTDLFRFNTGVTSFQSIFGGCDGLTGITNGLFDYNTKVTNFQGAFQGDINLASIPPNLFRNTVNVTSFVQTFEICRALKSIPGASDWFLPSLGELHTIYSNLHLSGISYTVQSYLSSSEIDASTIWLRDFAQSYWMSATFPKTSGVRYIPVRTFTSATSYNLRDVGPAGGWIFYKNGTTYYECTPTDYSPVVWSNITGSIAGASGLTIGSGQDNTNIIMNQSGFVNGGAKLCNDLMYDLYSSATGVTTFVQSFNGCSGLVNSAPEWWLRTPEPTGTGCFASDTGLTNYSVIPTTWGGAYDATTLKFEITTTTPSQSITLPHTTGTYNYTVDYGDGTGLKTVVAYNDANCTHVYTVASGYTVKIVGTCESIYVNNTPGIKDVITKVLSWGNVGLVNINFAGCSNLTSVPTDNAYSKGMKKVTGLQSVFQNCTKLTSIPAGIFDYAVNVNSFYYAFYNCPTLTSVPSDLFRYNTGVTSFNGLFGVCRALTTVPSNLFQYNTKVNDMSWMFIQCSGLTSIPVDLFRYNTGVTDFSYLFYQCLSLPTVPTDIFRYNTKATNFDYVFNNCVSISGITSGVFDYNVNATTFSNSFEACSALTGITVDLFRYCTGITSFAYTFRSCTNLVSTGITTDIFRYNTVVNSFNTTFGGCVKLTGITSGIFNYNINATILDMIFINCTGIKTIPVDLFRYNTKATSFFGIFQNCGTLSGMTTGLFDYNPNVTSFDYAFYGCTSLSGMTVDLFKNNTGVTNFSYTFAVCPRISGITTDIFRYNTKVLDFTSVFYNCDALSGITPGIFNYNVNVTTFQGAFSDCDNITSIPNNLFDTCTGVTNFANTFTYCTKITTIPTDLFKFNTKVTNFSFTFYRLSISSIPTDLFKYCPNVTTFEQCFYGSTVVTIPYTLFDTCTGVTNFLNMFSTCSSLANCNAPPLWIRSNPGFNPNTAGTGCFTSDTGLTNFSSIPTTWGGTNDGIMQLEVISATGSGLTMPHSNGYVYDYIVDWGDGTTPYRISSYNDTGTTHVYSAPVSGGYSDWFMPSKYELIEMYSQLKVPGFGEFQDTNYWSSTEINAANSWSSYFGVGGGGGASTKTNSALTRPCRTITGGTYSLRDRGPAGGRIFITGTTYYEAAPSDIPNGQWSNITNASSNATGETIGSGRNNTTLIMAQGGHTTSMAKKCDDYVGGYFTIKISGTCENININNTGTLRAALIRVIKWGNVGLRFPNFYGCQNLISLASDTTGLYKVNSLNYGFAYCTSLTTIPTGLFDYATGITTFNSAFEGCTSLTAVPSNLFKNSVNATIFTGVFNGCSKITTIGTNGWFLPSKDELNEMYTQLHSYGVGGFNTSSAYWSSTEGWNTAANSQNFSNGTQGFSSKDALISNTRACRTFTGGTYSLRSIGPEGGLIFITGATYYEAAPVDMLTNQAWSNITNIVSNATGYTIGTGLLNTNTIIGQVGHTYSTAMHCKNYTVGIFSGATNADNMNGIFVACSKLSFIPTDIFRYNTKVTSFHQVFMQCLSISGISYDMFRANVNVTTMSYLFYSCPIIQSVPVDLFRYNTGTTTFFNTFGFCYALSPTGITTDIFRYNTKVVNFGNTFASCTSLTGITSGLFNYNVNVTSFDSTFTNCSNLLSMPNGLFNYNTGVTSFYGIFQSCTSLTAIPTDLFKYNTMVNTFENVFSGCLKVAAIPTGLFNTSVNATNYRNSFSGMYALTSIPTGLFDASTGVTTFASTFQANAGLTGNAPLLWLRTTGGLVGTSCFTSCTGLTNYSSIPISWGGSNDGVMELEIATTSPSQSVTIPHYTGYVYNYVVNWGDGTSNTVTGETDTRRIHIYATGGTYSIRISGTCENIYVNNTGTLLPVLKKVIKWGYVGMKWPQFYGCSNLTSIATDTVGLYTANNFDTSFSTTNISIIPTDIFRYATGVTSFNNVFYNCKSLSGITSGIFDYSVKATTFRTAFANCSAISNVPAGLFSNCVSATDFYYAFGYNYALTGVTGTIFKNCGNVTNLEAVFTNCHNLTAVPGVYDWFLPSKDELHTMYSNLKLSGVSNLGDVWYWSSSEVGTGAAWAQFFYDGSQNSSNAKSNTFYVRAIRSFTSSINYNLRDVGPAGGYIFHKTGNTYYECASTDQSSSRAWSSITGSACGATGTTIGTGQSNTNLMVAQGGTNAGQLCDDYSLGIFDTCTGVTSVNNLFANCYKITSIPPKLFTYNTRITDFTSTFQYCTGVTSIPAGMFSTNVNASLFIGTFSYCNQITSVPIDLFRYCTGATDFQGIFQNTALTSTGVTTDIFRYNTKATGFRMVFSNCTSLTGITTGIFNYNVNATTFRDLFAYCSALTSIPTGLFDSCTGVTNLSYAFNSCSNLVSVPADLFKYNTLVNDFSYTFYSCIKLESTGITSDIFRYNTKVTDFSYVFSNCQTFTGITSGIFSYNPNVTTFNSTFSNCTKLISIPSGLFDTCTGVTTFAFIFGNCGKLESTGITSDIFRYNTKVTTFINAFTSCVKLTGLTAGIFNYNVNANIFDSTFQSCTNLQYIPAGLFNNCTGATSFNGTFWACNYLTSTGITTDIFRYNTVVTNFQGTFGNCQALSAITSGIFNYNVNVTNFSRTFESCLALTAIPATLFDNCTGVTTFNSTFYNIGATLTGNAPALWNRTSPTPTGTQCFYNDTNLTNYASIPAGWK